MEYPWAVPGAKVVCVDAEFLNRLSPLVVENIYTVAKIIEDDGTPSVGPYAGADLLVILDGVLNPYEDRGGFALARFRPLITQADDVAKFAWMLTDTKEKVDA